MGDYRTPLRRARGLGSAKHGVGHFIAQRVSAVALVLLVCWGFSQTPFLVRGGHDFARAWLASPLNATLLILLAGVGFYHGQIGMQVIIEDYVDRGAGRTALLILNAFVWLAAAALTTVSLLLVALGRGAV
ncbi:MAG TPA: succinate dehydrogenase, hydrophobic membrane anchor protein [Caulobacteraceae bacterium]|jgi:succinate dehydrogenase / fumarate reductase membrane anchor subunit